MFAASCACAGQTTAALRESKMSWTSLERPDAVRGFLQDVLNAARPLTCLPGCCSQLNGHMQEKISIASQREQDLTSELQHYQQVAVAAQQELQHLRSRLHEERVHDEPETDATADDCIGEQHQVCFVACALLVLDGVVLEPKYQLCEQQAYSNGA